MPDKLTAESLFSFLIQHSLSNRETRLLRMTHRSSCQENGQMDSNSTLSRYTAGSVDACWTTADTTAENISRTSTTKPPHFSSSVLLDK